MNREPINNYVYQPYGIEKTPYIYGVSGIDNISIKGLTQEEAVIIAEALNRIHNRPTRGNGDCIFQD